MIPIYITDITWFTAINSDVMSFKKIHEPKLWPNPCNSHVMSHCLCLFHMCMEVLCQGFWVEALRGSTSWSLSLKRCRKLFFVWKSLRSFQLGTVFSSGTCHKRRSDGDRPEFGHPDESSQVLEDSGQKHQLLLVQFLPISISRGILPLNRLFLVTVDHPSSKLRHGSQRFLWCCYSSRGRKNFEVDLGEISWNNVKA